MDGSDSLPDSSWLDTLPKHRMAAGALFFDKAGRALLVDPTYTPGWDYPGGVVEIGETPFVAACREVEEELGLSIRLGPLLVVDWEPAREELPLAGCTLTFDGGVLSAEQISAIRLAPGELGSFRFCRPSEAADLLPAHLARRVAAAIEARTAGSMRYLEDGYPVD